MEKIKAQAGNSIKGDKWLLYATLVQSNGFSDRSFPGCHFKLSSDGPLDGCAVNVKVTGAPRWNGWEYQSRCKIEFVGDDQPSEFVAGSIYTK